MDMLPVVQRLDSLLKLKSNWDGYDADAPIPAIVDRAKVIAPLLEKLGRASGRFPEVYVYPTRIGGVQIEWFETDREWELELMQDGSIETLETNTVTNEMRTEKFEPNGTVDSTELLRFLNDLATPLAGVSA